MTDYIQNILTILSLVNPVICASIFSEISAGKSRNVKFAEATKAVLSIMVILSLSALGGAQMLKVFGISLDAFQVAGGLVLLWMGFIMLKGNASPTTGDESETKTQSLTPLILFAASPGTITGVITLSVAHSQHNIPVITLVSVVIALSITWLIMLLATRSSSKQKGGLIHDVTTRFMGLIVLAMGVQFILAGWQKFFTL